MKVRFVAFLLVLAILLPGCYSEADLKAAREEAYSSGYEEGLAVRSSSYTEADIEAAYNEGFDAGFFVSEWTGSSSSPNIDDVLAEAESYAYIETGNELYDAWNEMMVYIDGDSPAPSWDEFLSYSSTVVYYCMYLSEYNRYYEPPFTDAFE